MEDLRWLSSGKRDAILWAISMGFDWRYAGGSTVEAHFPEDVYCGWDRNTNRWVEDCPHYRTIYDETCGDVEFVPPSEELISAMKGKS
jgi:hypothetical protein